MLFVLRVLISNYLFRWKATAFATSLDKNGKVKQDL